MLGPPITGPEDWNGSRPRRSLVHGFVYNLCSVVSSCLYVFCCCWLIEDCCMGRRGYLRSPFGPREPPPPPPPIVGPIPQQFGSVFGQPGPPGPASRVI